MPRSISDSPAAPVLAAAAALALLLTVGGCRFVKGPWTARPAGGDTAAVDSGVVVDTAGTVAAGDTVAVVPVAPADTASPDSVAVGDTAAAGAGAADSATAGDTAAAPPDSVSGDTVPAGERPTVEMLEEMGPTYTPYDISPQLLPGDWLTALLSDTLAPVVDRHDELSVEDFALYWVLVDADGTVRDAVLHTTSDSDAFDTAARVVAERLRYRPAIADDEAVPVWVLTRVSLLMR